MVRGDVIPIVTATAADDVVAVIAVVVVVGECDVVTVLDMATRDVGMIATAAEALSASPVSGRALGPAPVEPVLASVLTPALEEPALTSAPAPVKPVLALAPAPVKPVLAPSLSVSVAMIIALDMAHIAAMRRVGVGSTTGVAGATRVAV